MATADLPRITPRLIVARASEAIDFYVSALDAEVFERFDAPNLDNLVVHAALKVGGSIFSLAGEHPEWGNHSPESLEGSAVMITLEVEDADAVAKRMIDGGAEVVVPVADQFYGKREGRLRDPFGHLWILSQLLEKLSDEEIQSRMANFASGKS